MRLLVSVTNKREAIAALEGGADFIDAKDPSVGALGAVSIDALQQIVEAVGASRPVTAALGDAISEEWLEYTAERVAATGVSLVKVGFARLGAGRAVSVTRAAIRGVWAGSHGRCGLVAVAYADASRAGSPSPATIVDFAARVGAAGVLVDTFDKDGSGLCDLLPFHELVDLAEAAHDGGLLLALAGKLTAHQFEMLSRVGVDVVGVRGAACEGGRMGQVSRACVRALAKAVRNNSRRPPSTVSSFTPTGSARAK